MRAFSFPFITLFAVALNHAARFTLSTSILFLLYCAAALLLSIFHVSTEVLVAIVRRPILSTLYTHRCIVLVSATLACGWFVTAGVYITVPNTLNTLNMLDWACLVPRLRQTVP